MGIERVSAEKVKRAFMLTHLFRELFRGREDEHITNHELEDHYAKTLAYLNGLSEDGISYLINKEDPIRLGRYDDFRWCEEKVNFDYMGSWPKMYDLDIRFTLGNISETAEKVKKVLDGKYGIPFSEKAGRKFPGQLRAVEFNSKNFPLILFPGGTIRENGYNRWARREGKLLGMNKLLCEIFPYDVDDGNGRAVSFSIKGLKRAPAYIATKR